MCDWLCDGTLGCDTDTKIPSYVRCIKPNHKKIPKKIEDELLRHQVALCL